MDDDYFARVQEHLRELRFRGGVLVSARLGKGNVGIDYILRKPHGPPEDWLTRLFGASAASYTFHLHPRDEGGARALSELKQRGINPVANALAQSADHILSFLKILRTELAFYLGCVNLARAARPDGMPTCFPVPLPAGAQPHLPGLYDVCLALSQHGSPSSVTTCAPRERASSSSPAPTRAASRPSCAASASPS